MAKITQIGATHKRVVETKMIKKTLIVVLVVGLVAAVVTTAEAKKKKKGPKPYKSEEVTIQLGHPAFWGNSGTLVSVTAQEFLNACAIPNSNGLDAYVFEVPEDYKNVDSTIKAYGSGSTSHDIDIYLFDEACASVGAYNSTSVDEIGFKPAGTAYILLHNFGGIGTATGGGDTPVTTYFELSPAA